MKLVSFVRDGEYQADKEKAKHFLFSGEQIVKFSIFFTWCRSNSGQSHILTTKLAPEKTSLLLLNSTLLQGWISHTRFCCFIQRSFPMCSIIVCNVVITLQALITNCFLFPPVSVLAFACFLYLDLCDWDGWLVTWWKNSRLLLCEQLLHTERCNERISKNGTTSAWSFSSAPGWDGYRQLPALWQ